jgi:hypothetical protein
MKKRQLEEIAAIKEQLQEIYAELVEDNELDASKRVDTIIYKISALENIYREN